MTPLHSGSPTWDGDIVIPSHFTSSIHASAMYCGPQSHRIRSPRATSLPNRPKAWRTPCRIGFQGGPSIAELGGVPADDVSAVVIDGAEEPAPAVRLRVEPRRVGAPHLVRPRRGDRAGVRRVAIRWPEAPRGQELVLAHEAQPALAPDSEAAMGQAGADLAIALAMERRGRQHRADRDYELGVAGRRLRAALAQSDV